MNDPLSQRCEDADRVPFASSMAPPPLPPRSGLRPLRVLPSLDSPQEHPLVAGQAPETPESSGLLLRRELEAAHNELNALQDMLEELPAILERKFQQRLRGLLEQQALLIARNEALRERLPALTPAPQPAFLSAEGAAGRSVGGLSTGFRHYLLRALDRNGTA
jgi:hypothetical protein